MLPQREFILYIEFEELGDLASQAIEQRRPVKRLQSAGRSGACWRQAWQM